MTDNEKRAHDLSLVITMIAAQTQYSNSGTQGLTLCLDALAYGPNDFDPYSTYRETYKVLTRFIDRDFADKEQ